MEGAESLFHARANSRVTTRRPAADRLRACVRLHKASTRLESTHIAKARYSTRLASSALPSVTSSANSRSPPTGRPLARRVTLMPKGLIRRAR